MNRRDLQPAPQKRSGKRARAPGQRSVSVQLADLAGRLGRASVGLLLVLVVLIPGDSVAVERGDALLLVWPALLAAVCAVLVFHASGIRARRAALLTCGCWIGLAAWMWISVLANLTDANVRAAINESWYWTATAASFVAAAVLFQTDAQRRTLVALFFAILVSASFHAAYQYAVTMPRDLELLAIDPDTALRRAGIDPNADPVTRRMLIDRLAGREPIAAFALTNSLAGLLVSGIVLAVAIVVLPGSQRNVGWRPRLLWIAVALFAGVILLLTKSRSAWLAAMCGFALIPLALFLRRPGRGSGSRPSRSRASESAKEDHEKPLAGQDAQQNSESGSGGGSAVGLRGALLVGAAGALLVAGVIVLVASDRLVLSGAPQSMRVRLDYWRASIAMIVDRPLVGFAPGNFQSAYSAYRLPSAHEQIADPHNFVFELATTGGVPAALSFLAVVLFGIASLLRSGAAGAADPGGESAKRAANRGASALPRRGPGAATESLPRSGGLAQAEPDPAIRIEGRVDWSVFAGAIIAIPSAWIGGYILGVAPDPEPYIFGIPLAVAVLLIGQSWVRGGLLPHWAVAMAMITLLVHLGTTGGLTVPGVLLPIALLAGADLELWRLVPLGGRGAVVRRPKRIAAAVLVALMIVVGLFFVSAWLPVRGVQQSTADAELLARQGRIEQAIQVLQSGAALDPFDPQVAAFAASLRGAWDLQYGGQWTTVLQQLVESSIERDPRSPAVYAAAADQRVLFYQRTGDGDHLRSASELYRAALERFPAGIRLRVQLALVERAMGDRRQSRQYAREAARLIEHMEFFDASLEAIPVLDPEFDSTADGSAARISVRQALANLQ